MLLLGSDLDNRNSVQGNGLNSNHNGGEERCKMENGGGDNDPVSQLFDQFCHASTCRAIISSFQQLCDAVGLSHADHRNFYRKLRARISTWKAHALWVKLDKRANHKEYRRGEACANTKVIIIGGGICGLRVAIETALLGARTVIVEKRDRFSRNNVLHLWPFLIVDLKNLGAKKFYGKFCAGAIDHISIRQLQCILLKAALIVGVEIHVNVSFEDIIEPTSPGQGWRVKVEPENHPLSEYEFDVLIGADGKRNTLQGFKRKEFRGKLAIAITANFINRNTQAEARVEEISGVAFIFNQKFFKDLNEAYGIDLENIVYYKDETHYFVMTAKKQSLLEKGVLKRDYSDTAVLLSYNNVNQDALANYAREAADFCTKHKMPHLDFAVNHYGRPDLAMFDFTSLFQADNSCRVLERQGKKLLTMLVGDSLLEPFWPTGSGCARGFLGAFDAAWMIKQWSSGKMTPLQVIAERESVYQLLSQTTPENLRQNHAQFTLDPASRYTNMKSKWLKPKQVMHLYDTGDNTLRDEVIEIPAKSPQDDVIDTYSLLRWCQKILNTGKYHTINVTDLSSSWKSGLAFCALLHFFKPEAIEYDSLNEADVIKNNQLAFDVAHKEFGINPVLTGEDMANCDKPDKLTIVSYLSQFYDLFKKQRPPSDDYLNSSFDENRKHRSPSHRMSILQKLRSSRVSLSKLKKSIKKEKDMNEEYNINQNNNNNNNFSRDNVSKLAGVLSSNWESQNRDNRNGNVELMRYSRLPIEKITSQLGESNVKNEIKIHKTRESCPKLPMDEITNRLTRETPDQFKDIKMKEEMMPVVKVSKMAELLVSKFKKNSDQPPPEPLSRKVKGQPMMVAAQPASEFCFFCGKRVYIMERMSVENVFFHSQCFKCEFCGVLLRSNTYSVDKNNYGDAYRFFCFRHALPQSRFGKPARKRVAEDVPDDVSKKNIPCEPADLGPTPTKVSATSRSPTKQKPEMLSPVSNTEDLNSSLKTPERIEFENTIEGLQEETEEEQWEHNMSMSLSRGGELEMEMQYDEDEDSDDSDLESEDEEFQEAVDLYTSGRLEESISLARESLRHSRENLLKAQEADEDTEVEEYDEESETEDSDTEMEDETFEPNSTKTESHSEARSATESRSDSQLSINRNNSSVSEPVSVGKVSNLQPASSTSQSQSTVTNGANSSMARAARADFFTSPPEPLRLDPFKMFGMARKNPVKEEPVSQSNGNGETKPPVDGEGDVESDEGTDRQVGSHVLDIKAQQNESNNTDDDLDEAFVSAEYEPLIEDDEKVAVSRAMEQLLVDMDHRSESLSDSNDELNGSSDSEVDDDVFHQYRRQLSSRDSTGSRSESVLSSSRSKSKNSLSSSDFDKNGRSVSNSSSSADKLKKSDEELRNSKESLSDRNKSGSLNELGTTEKSVLRSVQQMSDNSGSTGGSGETTLKVLQSVSEIKEQKDDDEIERCIQYLDDKFVTRRARGSHRSGKSNSELKKSGSSDSFTISTPSHSPCHTASSSLSEEFEYNKNILAQEREDERPDSDMLRDYHMTLSQVLDEDNDGEEPFDNAGKEDEDLDATLHAEEALDASPASPASEYMSPRSEMGDASDKSDYVSPRSERNSSMYETPETSLNEKSASDLKEVTESLVENESSASKKEPSKKSILPSFVQTKISSKPETSKCVQSVDVKKKKSGSLKPPKKIKQEIDETDPVKNTTKTIIRAYKHGSREGSVESNHLEKDAWGSSSSTSSLNSINSAEASQKTWRPLPPLPIESQTSPTQSRTVKQGTGRKLPEPVGSKSPQVFQSNFMKKAYSSNTDSNDSSTNTPSPNENRKPVITSQPRPLPPKPGESKPGKPEKNVSKVLDKSSESSGLRTKITVDYSKLNIDKDSASETDTKKKRIPVASALKKSLKPSLSGNSVGEQSDDIPFADDSENDVIEEKFFTPATSIKPKRKAVGKEGESVDARKRILPTPPKSSEPAMLSPDRIRDIRKAEIEKARDEARERARLKSDEELGLRDTPSVSKYKRTVSTESSQSNYASAAESDELKTPLQKVSVSFTPEIPFSNGSPTKAKGKKKKKSKSRESSLSSIENLEVNSEVKKDKKKRSLLASILSGVKTPTDKPKEFKDRDKSSSTDTLEDKSAKKKKTKTPKTDKKKDKKKRKTVSMDEESLLSENMNQLKIGAVFSEKPGKRPALRGRIVPPKASVDDFTDSEEEFPSMGTSMTSLNDSQSRRTKSDHGPLSEEELNARITRKIQHAARKQQKQQEQKRLRQAQEIQRKLQEVDVKQRELEERGVSVERALRGEGPEGVRSETELMQEWFNLVHDKNALVRLESELMVSARELELEDRQGRLQHQLRESMALDGLDLDLFDDEVFEEPNEAKISKYREAICRNDSLKSPLQREREQKIYSELIEVVEERDKLVAMLEEERVREREEDRDLENVMRAKGFSLSPTSGSKILRKTRPVKAS
ncbi:F-actin-monooxygenase MICAL3-like isoform X2 [Mercenaria mercenaria]|uniref:F-actin-monooxygenase MICAL3-like isoform X2 n=1 Tax=Mercenaria mercenaria TaxID=6596 RepID=UPI00234EF5ED|nr:F-actin-monooxygenase MICAL3-like isoform X2 [Mercenaria mercenaria]